MSTTASEVPDYGATYMPMSKATGPMFMSGPSVSTHPQFQPGPPHLANGYITTSTTEFTNLTPMMSTPQFSAQTIMANTSFAHDSSNPSSASSSRTKLQNIGCDDSGISSHNGSLLMSNLPQMGAFGSPQMEIKLEDDLEAMPRDRSNTWPLRRPTLDINAQTSPLIHDRIPEEENIYDSSENLSRSGSMLGQGTLTSNGSFSNDFNHVSLGSPEDLHETNGSESPNSASKKATTRRNAWGNMSYADLITQAILNSPEKRLTLSQVYEWMVQNVPYFRDKGDSNSSAGWKNSIRHNLSLHSRFMRIQNEGAGKSSWWVINPDAKPGRNPRRRAQTMESSTKAKIDKCRRGARKRLELGSLRSAGSSAIGSTASIVSHEIFNDQDDPLNSNFDTFRPRTHSNLSTLGNSARISPTVDRFEDFDFPPPPWDQRQSSNPEVNEIMGRTGEMRLDSAPDYKTDFRGAALNDTPTLLGDFPGPKLEFDDPPPPYPDIAAIRPGMPMQPPMMRTTFNPPHQRPPMQSMRMAGAPNGYYQPPVYANGPMMAPPMNPQQPQQWSNPALDYPPTNMTPLTGSHVPPSTGGYFDPSQQGNSQLPMDLEGLSLPDTMDFNTDIDAVLRHEFNQTPGQQIHFDL